MCSFTYLIAQLKQPKYHKHKTTSVSYKIHKNTKPVVIVFINKNIAIEDPKNIKDYTSEFCIVRSTQSPNEHYLLQGSPIHYLDYS